MHRAVGACGNERQVDVGGQHVGQFDLGFFSRFTDPLHGHLVSGQVDAVLFLEFIAHPVHDPFIEVIAAQMGIPVGGFHFEHSVAQFQDGHIEGAAAQVVNQDGVVVGFINAVSQSCSRGFVDDPFYIQPGDPACILGGLTLAVVEVSRYGDDGFGDFFTQIPFCIALHLFQDHGGNLFRRIILAVNGHRVFGAHVPFDGADGPFRVGYSLAFGQLAYQSFPVFRKANHGRSQPAAFLGGNNRRFAAFHHSDYGVGGP